MKTVQFVLKIAAAALALAAAACCIVAFWDKIEAAFAGVKSKCCKSGCDNEYDDYVDWSAE